MNLKHNEKNKIDIDKFCQIPQLSFGNKDASMVGIWTKASILEHRHTQSLYLISKQNPLDRSCMLIGHAHQGSKPSKRSGTPEQVSPVDPQAYHICLFEWTPSQKDEYLYDLLVEAT